VSGLKVYRIDEDGEIVKSVRDKILSAEQFLATLPQVEIPVDHKFSDGLYSRKILIPAGTCVTGKVHRKGDISIVQYGRMMVLTEDGFKEIVGPCDFVGTPGVKKIGYAVEDTLWINVIAANSTDLDSIVEEVFIECEGEPHVIDLKTGRQIQKELPSWQGL
jgi:hypothetical protein